MWGPGTSGRRGGTNRLAELRADRNKTRKVDCGPVPPSRVCGAQLLEWHSLSACHCRDQLLDLVVVGLWLYCCRDCCRGCNGRLCDLHAQVLVLVVAADHDCDRDRDERWKCSSTECHF